MTALKVRLPILLPVSSRTWPSAASLALALGLCVFGCSKKDAPKTEPMIRPVRTAVVQAGGGTESSDYSGIAQAGTESKLSFKVFGTISKINVKVGDKIKRGDTIAVLEGTDQSLQVQASDAQVSQAEAQVRNAKAQYERVKRLYENNNASQQQLDQARAAAESAEAAVRAAKKQEQLARSQASYTRLVAKSDGVIAAVNVELGENVGAGTPVAVMNSDAQTEVSVALPESRIGQVKEGDKADVRFDAIEGETFSAVVTEVGVTTGQGASTFPVVLRLEKDDPRIRSGMAATARLNFDAGQAGQPAGLYVDSRAVGEDRNGRYVFVVTPAEAGMGTVKRQQVQVGRLTSRGVEITQGLNADQVVVTAGVRLIEDGAKVRLKPAQKPDAAKAASSPGPAPSAASDDAESPAKTPAGSENQ